MSEDLFHWQRLGLATFAPWHGIELGNVDDKDASLFPVAIPNPSGHPELAHAPPAAFPGTRPEETACHPASRDVDLDRESIWISYCPTALKTVSRIASAVHLSSPAGDSGVALGAAQNRRRHSAHPDQARLADRLSRSQRNGGAEQRWTSSVLLGRGDGAFERASADDPLSFGGAGVDAGAAAGTRRDHRQRRVPHRHRPARRSGHCRTASTSITEWRTTGLAWRALTSRSSCRQEESPTRHMQRYEGCKPEQEIDWETPALLFTRDSVGSARRGPVGRSARKASRRFHFLAAVAAVERTGWCDARNQEASIALSSNGLLRRHG